MPDIDIARVLHVLAVVIWIGGVAIATTGVLPAVRHGELGEDRLRAFQAIERRFAWLARSSIVVTGATGLYMSERLHLWARFHVAAFWWMHAMVGTWLLFFLLLFVVEPFVLHRYFQRWAASRPQAAFAWLHWVHGVLLGLAVVTIAGAVAGSHGWSMF